jgi:predicted RNA binding protein YcfA (HicA-like mRNA interferase family)
VSPALLARVVFRVALKLFFGCYYPCASQDSATHRDLEKHGFVNRGGKGSHRNFVHPSGVKITLSGVSERRCKTLSGTHSTKLRAGYLKRAIERAKSRARRLIVMLKLLRKAKKTNATSAAVQN